MLYHLCIYIHLYLSIQGFPDSSVGKESINLSVTQLLSFKSFYISHLPQISKLDYYTNSLGNLSASFFTFWIMLVPGFHQDNPNCGTPIKNSRVISHFLNMVTMHCRIWIYSCRFISCYLSLDLSYSNSNKLHIPTSSSPYLSPTPTITHSFCLCLSLPSWTSSYAKASHASTLPA